MGQRRLLWAVTAGFVVGAVLVGVVAVSDGGGRQRLPALAIGAGTASLEAMDGGGSRAPDGGDRVDYRFEGELPDLPDRASVRRLDRSVPRNRVAALARALGLDGEVHESDGALVVTDGDRQLRVEGVPGAPWNLGPTPQQCHLPGTEPGVRSGASSDAGAGTGDGSEPAVAGEGGGGATVPDGDGCVTVEGGAASPGAVSPGPADGTVSSDPADGTVSSGPAAGPEPEPGGEPAPRPEPLPAPEPEPRPEPEPEPEPERPEGMPSRAEAERIGRDVLTKAGVDLAGATVRVDDGFSMWSVTAEPLVGGLPTTGITAGVSVGPHGVVEWASGWLGVGEAGEEYPLADVETALERLENQGGWSPYPAAAMERRGESPEGGPEPGTGKVVRTVTAVRLGLMFAPLASNDPDDRPEALLVPAYLFALDDGAELPVIAVADEYLPDEPEPEEPEPGPEPAPEPRPGPEPGPEPAPEPGPGPGAHGCAGSSPASADGGDNAPLELQVCGPQAVVVGEEAVFELTAADPDAAFTDRSCVAASFGDEDMYPACPMAACVPGGASPPAAKEPGKLARQFPHTYAEPGVYTARFEVESGEQCATPYASRGTVELRVEVHPRA